MTQSKNLLLDDIGPVALREKLFPTSSSTSTDPEDPASLLPSTGQGKSGLLSIVETILAYSTNTWHQGFLDKLYHNTTAVGVATELLLATLNTNVHVYKVSPALSVIERATSRALAALYGLNGPHAGGIVQAGGSASNLTALIVARNTLFPETKTHGNAAIMFDAAGQPASKGFAIFTSAHGHYSFEKACQIAGMGARAAVSVPVDPTTGSMIPSALSAAIIRAKDQGYTPLLVNATAGTTVLGSYDPFAAIADICAAHALWLHVDGSWGGAVVFSERLRASRLRGIERADSIALNPHKMLGAPVQCSFLLARDLRTFWRSNTLPASYLFHADSAADGGSGGAADGDAGPEIWDLADLTLQCGRRGDALKLALGWVYYGREGYAAQIDGAFDVADYFAGLVESQGEAEGAGVLGLVSQRPPPCLQVCFYYRPAAERGGVVKQGKDKWAVTNERTKAIASKLQDEEFLVDYATGDDGLLFLRAVVGLDTTKTTVERLVKTVARLGAEEDGSK